jgi:uncharacterized protein (TIGR04255 family)
VETPTAEGASVDACYERPFIKEAIVRVDLSPPIDLKDTFVEGPFAAAAKGRFPNLEPRVHIGQEFQFGPEGMAQKKVETREWQVLSAERDRRIVLGDAALAVSCTAYTRWVDLRDDFFSALDALVAGYPDAQVTRLGVRYINFISLQEVNPFDWKGWIADELTGSLNFPRDPRRIARSMHVLELEYPDDVRLKFQFGLPNPDYPAPVKEKHFVLDLDAYVGRILTVSEVKGLAEPMHGSIEQLFEDGIGQKLRTKMGVVNDAKT